MPAARIWLRRSQSRANHAVFLELMMCIVGTGSIVVKPITSGQNATLCYTALGDIGVPAVSESQRKSTRNNAVYTPSKPAQKPTNSQREPHTNFLP